MWTSRRPGRPPRSTRRRRALEACALAIALGLLPELVAAHAGVVLEPLPGWIAVLILAARYGVGGLFAGAISTAAAVAIGASVAGSDLATLWSRLDTMPELSAFGACLTVSWVASWHLRRQDDLRSRLRAASERADDFEATIATLREVVGTLRARVDRTAASLSFLRDVAARLEGSDPIAAAEGAADLALARTGASASAVMVGMSGFQRTLAVRDTRRPKVLAPLKLRGADLTVPICNGNDRIGVIALWGVAQPTLDEATTCDLEVITSWCARALAVVAWHPGKVTVRALEVS